MSEVISQSYNKKCRLLALFEVLTFILFIAGAIMLFCLPIMVIDSGIIAEGAKKVDPISFSFLDEFKSVFQGDYVSSVLHQLPLFKTTDAAAKWLTKEANSTTSIFYGIYAFVIVGIVIVDIVATIIHISLYLVPARRAKQYDDLRNNKLSKRAYRNRYGYSSSSAATIMIATLFVIVFTVVKIFTSSEDLPDSSGLGFLSAMRYVTNMSWKIVFPIILMVAAQVTFVFQTKLFNKMCYEIRHGDLNPDLNK